MEDEEQALLAKLNADDWNTARDAVEVASDWLRTRKVGEFARAELASRLLQLASHPKWEIRKAIAHAILYLQHDKFLATIGALLDDENAWVREAARKTLRRREGLTRADIGGINQGDAILDQLSALETRYGLRAQQAASKVAERLHQRFVKEAYHEISRIIAPLDAFLINLANELELAPGITDRTLQSCRRARGRVRLITEFLDNLRAFTADEPSVFALERLRPIIKDGLDLAMSHQDAVPGNDIEVQLAVDGSFKLEVSRSHLLQAFINIIANAVDACTGQTRRGMIAICAQAQQNSHVQITIADNGYGMSAEAVQDCMLLYSSGKVGGMGFGLPLAMKIIEIGHRGTLSIESRSGAGTTVTIMLPIEQLRSKD